MAALPHLGFLYNKRAKTRKIHVRPKGYKKSGKNLEMKKDIMDEQ
jgi:hypothetical protein